MSLTEMCFQVTVLDSGALVRVVMYNVPVVGLTEQDGVGTFSRQPNKWQLLRKMDFKRWLCFVLIP
jgi:hypothetical protein